jgi:signal transduction histidine kinase
MSDIISNLRKKHTWYVTGVAGILLAIILGIAVGSFFISLDIEADNILNTVLSSYDSPHRPEALGASRCFAFLNDDGTVVCSKAYEADVEYYKNGILNIINDAINKENGNFNCEGHRFVVKSVDTKFGKIYAVYDRTEDILHVRSAVLILTVAYALTIIIVALFAFAFSAMTTKPLKDAFNMQKDLVANASHELKTPLAIISANLAVMNSEKDSTIQDNAKWIESISSQVDRMNQLVKEMLELSRLEQSPINTDVVDFGSIVESACLEIEAVAFERGASLYVDVQKDLYVHGDKPSLERLIIILLDNALKYCGESGKVECSLKAEGKKLHLKVMNTGSAISDSEAERVFDRFYRSDSARQNPDNKSFGLGLAIAKATVGAHGGTISCKGITDKGSVFEVYLPAVRKKGLFNKKS